MISLTNSDKGSITMKFSTRDRYALRLMVELANHPNDLIPLKDISDKQRISLKYLEQIVTPLACAAHRAATVWPARLHRSPPARSCAP